MRKRRGRVRSVFDVAEAWTSIGTQHCQYRAVMTSSAIRPHGYGKHLDNARMTSMPITTVKSYRGRHQKRLNPFIEQFVNKIRVCNQKHYRYTIKHWGYPHHNLLYKERELYSLMTAAMHQLTPVYQSESKVIRLRDRRNPIHRGQERTAIGRVDLWAQIDSLEYYFEFKRSYCDIRYLSNRKDSNRIHRPWRNLVEQVKQVRAGLQNEPNTCCIGLQVITPFKTGRNKSYLADRKISLNEIKSFVTRFQPSPEAVLWYQNDKKSRVVPLDWDENDEETRWVLHPIQLFLFKILSA